jgi:CHAD domain-containing protein
MAPEQVVSATEIERKYVVDEGFELPPLTVVGAELRPAGRVDLQATYYDSDDLRLARNRITLRRRAGGADDGWHLKLPGGLADGRQELRLPLDAGEQVPDGLLDLVRVTLRGRPVEPVARLRTGRQIYRLCGDDGAELAEVVVDDVAADTPQSSSGWREVEVELRDGDRAVLDEVEGQLLAAGARPGTVPSKLARALGPRAAQPADLPAPATRLRRKDPAGAVVASYLREQAGELVRWDPRVRRDEPDSVHKMRVSARRLRSALQTFRPLLDREAARAMQDELKWIAAVLGAARDGEVLLARIRKELDAQPAELVMGPARARLQERLGGGLARAREELLDTLRGERYFALLDRLVTFAADPPFTPDAARPAGTVLPRLVGRTWRRLARDIDAALAHGDPVERDHLLHESRKAAKRARYAGESVAAVFGVDALKFAKRCEAVQETLGEHQDSVVAREVLRELGAAAGAAGENGFTFGLLHGVEHGRGDAARREFDAVWAQSRRRRDRRWLR